MRVLITGFGPFPGAPFNPSAALAKALARRRRPALAGIERATHVFATTYASVDRDLPKLFAQKPDIVLMFGVAGRRRQLCIETRARNAVSLLFPDAGGHRPRHGVIKLRRAGGTHRQCAIRAPCRRRGASRRGCRAMPAAICATTFTGGPWNTCAAPGRWCNSFISRRSAPSRGRGDARNSHRRSRNFSNPPRRCSSRSSPQAAVNR